MAPEEFIVRWEGSGGAELANSQSFLKELCDLLGVDQPEPTQSEAEKNRYVFEKAVEFNNGDGTFSFGRVDLYRAGCFVLESKQGSERKSQEFKEALATKTKKAKKLTGTAPRGTQQWERAMQAARQQAKSYAEAIPDEWPPFLVVADVGFCFDLYADFSGTGKNYVPFPDPRSFRIPLERLRDQKTRDLLRALWTDPHSLDPSKKAAQVTREIAERLAKLAKSLEAQHDPETVAGFLMRCLFTMFAEDVELIRKGGFTELLLSLRLDLHNFVPMVENLWEAMDEGKFSFFLREKVRHFNGKFFKDKTALPVTADQLELLIEAGSHDWQHVEPAIFGTLLERALDPVERHKLGAHFTPREYVERLVIPTIIQPLREEWDAVYAASVQLADEGKRKEVIRLLRDFHGKLCEIRVLDPACGSGNFLYVAMELMKRLEGEVVSALASFGDNVLPGITIDPHQFLGIEVNPRAAAIAELVLWIGFIQWHRRTRNDVTPPEPILRDYHNIECRDAVLDWDSIEPVVDEDGKPVTRWDGRTTKPNPVGNGEIPDETARVQELRYINPRKAEWSKADYIVGNPPFIGQQRMRFYLGDGYVNAIRKAWADVPETVDFVLLWWHKSAQQLRDSNLSRFGLVTTNSITQPLNRQVIANVLSGDDLRIIYAIPDHPWQEDGANGDVADVRVAMTVVAALEQDGKLHIHRSDRRNFMLANSDKREFYELSGQIQPDLSCGVSLSSCVDLSANAGLAIKGFELGSQGFLVPKELAESWLSDAPDLAKVLHPYMNGDDLKEGRMWRYVIDFHNLDVEQAGKYPRALQHVIDNVQSGRRVNRESRTASNWWLWRRSGQKLRDAISSLDRFIGTTRTSKFRVFQFCVSDLRAESKIVVVAASDAWIHGVLSSSTHELFSNRIGGFLGVGNDPTYNHTDCFNKFPFPNPDDQTRKRVRILAEQLDAHRKRQQQLHPTLTMTGMYNVLEKLRSGEPLTAKEQKIHEQGLVSVLKQIHDDLDAAVFDAYGWPHDLEDEEILQRLVDLNHERAEEENRGTIRWLRPEFQAPEAATQKALEMGNDGSEAGDIKAPKAMKEKFQKQPWPEKLPERMVAVRSALEKHSAPADAKVVASYYTRARATDVAELLETLAAVGSIRQLDDGRYAIGV